MLFRSHRLHFHKKQRLSTGYESASYTPASTRPETANKPDNAPKYREKHIPQHHRATFADRSLAQPHHHIMPGIDPGFNPDPSLRPFTHPAQVKKLLFSAFFLDSPNPELNCDAYALQTTHAHDHHQPAPTPINPEPLLVLTCSVPPWA